MGSARPAVRPVRHVPDAERRARLGVGHLLAPGSAVATPEGVAAALVALHSTEPPSVHLSCWARTPALAVADVDRTFWIDRTLVRQLCLRMTLFGVEVGLLPALLGGVCARMAARTRRDLARAVERSGIAVDGLGWVERAVAGVLAELERGEPLSAREVRERVPEAAASYAQGHGTTWASDVQLTPRVLWLLNLEGRIVRCGNDGDWRVSRPRWTTTERWLGAAVQTLDERAGYAELVGRWLASYGPGTVTDAAWWLGATKTAVRAALDDLSAVAVTLDGGGEPGWLLPDDVEPVAEPEPWVALLPLLDPSIMGWRERGFALGGHAPMLFDSIGNAGTSVWVDGRVIGAWVQDGRGAVQVRLLEDVPAGGRAALADAAARLTAWLDGQRVFPVYPSPAMRGEEPSSSSAG